MTKKLKNGESAGFARESFNSSLARNKTFLLLALIVVSARLIYSWSDLSFLLARIVDDAFYYYKTAQHIIEYGVSTFDGINPTNGYHPLWMVIILPIFYLTKGYGELSFRLVMTLQCIILGGIIFLLGNILGKRFGRYASVIGLCIFMWPRYLNQTEYGLEAGLLIFLLFLSARYCLKHNILSSEQDKSRLIVFGIILALVFLSRLDSVFYLLSIAIFFILKAVREEEKTSFQDKTRALLKKLCFCFIPASIIPLPYLAWNYYRFGHLTPISGSLKHSFPFPVFNAKYFTEFPEFAIIFILALCFLSFVTFKKDSFKVINKDDEYRAILTAFALYVVLHFLDTLFFMKWAVFRWHFAGYIVFLILFLPVITSALKNMLSKNTGFEFSPLSKGIIISILVTSALLMQAISAQRSIKNNFQYQCYKEAMWIRENTGKNDIFMLEDSGIVSYFSERKIVNIDGVINNFEFQDYLKKGNFVQYVKDKKIKYFSHHSFWGSPDVRTGNYKYYPFTSFSHLYDVPGGKMYFTLSDEIYRSPEQDHMGGKTIIIIWKIPLNYLK